MLQSFNKFYRKDNFRKLPLKSAKRKIGKVPKI